MGLAEQEKDGDALEPGSSEGESLAQSGFGGGVTEVVTETSEGGSGAECRH